MAMDEVIADGSRQKMQRLFPELIRLDLTINTNADDVPNFAQGIIINWSSEQPIEWLACCANPECRGVVQLDLVAVCRTAEEATALPPSLKERLLGHKSKRHPVDLRLKCVGSVGDIFAKNKTECPNMFHVTGMASFAE